MSYNISSFCSGGASRVSYEPRRNNSQTKRGTTKAEREKTSVRSTGKYCAFCNEMVAIADPDAVTIGNERCHKSCFNR